MRILCVGLATVDLVYSVPAIPGIDEKAQATGLTIAAGGPATNAAVTAAALGAEVTLVTAVGEHPLGELIRADLAAYRVRLIDTDPDNPAPPPVSAVTVLEPTGERTIVSRNAGDRQARVPATGLPDADLTLVDGHHPALAIAAARSARRLLVDAGSWRPVFHDLFPHAEVVACSATFRHPSAAPPGEDAATTARPAAADPVPAADPAADTTTDAGQAATDATQAAHTATDAAQTANTATDAAHAAHNATDAAQTANTATDAAHAAHNATDTAQAAHTVTNTGQAAHTATEAAQATHTASDAGPAAASTVTAARLVTLDAATAAAVGAPHVAITHGAGPVTWFSGGRSGIVAVPPVAAVDTAGAGDVFHGALAVALATGQELPVALASAVRIAGIRVIHPGPRAWLNSV